MSASTALTNDAIRQHLTHEQAIESLAKEMHAHIDQVRALFEAEHARLSSTARIKTYVSVIATRIVREALLHHSHSALQ